MTGLLMLIKSACKYKYSLWWVVPGLLLFACPMLLLVLVAALENKTLKKVDNQEDRAIGRFKVSMAIAFFLFYYLLFPLLTNILKYTSTNANWYPEIALVCVNVVMIALIPLYLYFKKRFNDLFINFKNNTV